MKRRNLIEISKEIRLKTLYFLLKGGSLHEISMNLGVKLPALKHRLTLIYKFYGVKTRHELMALYVNIPTKIRKSVNNEENQTFKRKKYKTKEQFKQNNEIFLPKGLSF